MKPSENEHDSQLHSFCHGNIIIRPARPAAYLYGAHLISAVYFAWFRY